MGKVEAVRVNAGLRKEPHDEVLPYHQGGIAIRAIDVERMLTLSPRSRVPVRRGLAQDDKLEVKDDDR